MSRVGSKYSSNDAKAGLAKGVIKTLQAVSPDEVVIDYVTMINGVAAWRTSEFAIEKLGPHPDIFERVGMGGEMVICIRRDQFSQKAVVASNWNGKCPRCGKGTYTGFVNVEHDGPCQ